MLRITKLSAGLRQIHVIVRSYWRQAALSRAQQGWLGFMLILTGSLLSLAFPDLTFFSAVSLVSVLCVLGWAAWQWPAMQLSTALLAVLYLLISLTNTAGQLLGFVTLMMVILLAAALVLAVVLELGNTSLRQSHVGLLGWLVVVCGVLAILLGRSERPGAGLHYAGLPMTGGYEVLLWTVVVMVFLYLLFLRVQIRLRGVFLGLLPATTIGLYLGGYYLRHGGSHTAVSEPVLEHGLLLVHVPLMILAFALLMNCAGFALLRLLSDTAWLKRRQNIDILETLRISLEDYLYRQTVLAVMLLGAGLLSGMLWADLAWGHYWHWEAKQVMTMAVWFYYLAGLHLRMHKGMQTRPFAWWCVAGIPVLVLTLLGTNWWPQGLHTFGAL